MSKSTPSLLALLGLVAVAGYQNRDKLAGLLGGAQPQPQSGGMPPDGGTAGAAAPGGSQGTLAGFGDAFRSGAQGGGGIAGGLGELMDRFRTAGKSQAAESWVSTGPNQPVGQKDLEEVIGTDTIAALVQKTGFTREDLLHRLSTALPDTVNRLTPQGRLPSEDEARGLI